MLMPAALLAASSCGGGDAPTPESTLDRGRESVTRLNNLTVQTEAGAADRMASLSQVDHWFYYLGFDPEDGVFDAIAASDYDMVVMEPVFTERGNTDFDVSAIVETLHSATDSKLVIAYIDIGQAEDWRTYWQPGWKIGDPGWIVADDPDGWEGNYPVAYWSEEWRSIWLGEGGYLQQIIDAGFDGVYLDWVEAYSDVNVLSAAGADGVDATGEMIRWVNDIAAFGRNQDDGFIVIAQNAAELAEDDSYLQIIDAIAQEQVWFDGGADNEPAGDCPLPRTEDEVESDSYIESLSNECLRFYEEFPGSTLYMSSEEYLKYLTEAQRKGKVIFTVDYALEPENISWVYRTSRGLGFKPFVSERNLATYIEPYPLED